MSEKKTGVFSKKLRFVKKIKSIWQIIFIYYCIWDVTIIIGGSLRFSYTL